jgi:hypothetical protein
MGRGRGNFSHNGETGVLAGGGGGMRGFSTGFRMGDGVFRSMGGSSKGIRCWIGDWGGGFFAEGSRGKFSVDLSAEVANGDMGASCHTMKTTFCLS